MDKSNIDICPISLECALVVPRRSIDIAADNGLRNTRNSVSSGQIKTDGNLSADTSSIFRLPDAGGHKATTAAERAGPMSAGPTPAEYLTSDGRLNVSFMMEQSNELTRQGSRNRISEARKHKSASRSCHGSPGTAARSTEPDVENAAAFDEDPNIHDPLLVLQLTQQQQQLAAACRTRDMKLLQQVLSGPVTVSAALDEDGNTALHLLLLLPDHLRQRGGTASNLQHSASDVSLASAAQRSSNTPTSISTGNHGLFSLLFACFSKGKPRASSSCSAAATNTNLVHTSVNSRSVGTAASAALFSALLASGANVNVRNHNGDTPIMLAVQQLVRLIEGSASSGRISAALKVLDMLCRHPMADLNMKDSLGRTALGQLMLPATTTPPSSAAHDSASVGGKDSSIGGASAVTNGSVTAPLSSAAAAAHLKAVQMLINCGSDLNASDHSGMTILMLAAAQPTVTKELLQLLLQSGANPLSLDGKRRSALTHAMLAQQLKLVPAHGPGYERWQGAAARQALATSSGSNCGGCMRQTGPTSASSFAGLQRVSAEQQSPNKAGMQNSCTTPVSNSEAASSLTNSNTSSHSISSQEQLCSPYASPFPLSGHGSVIRALCSYGSLDLHPGSINTRFPAIDGYSQLHIAMRRGDVRAQELLLASGADVNALDSWGNSPLMYWPVAPSDPPDVVETLVAALLRHGADPNLPNSDGWTPLDLACELDKLNKIEVKPKSVPIHALLVGYGAKNSDAFMTQHKHQPTMLCLRTDSANSVLRVSKGYDSLRVVVPSVGDDLMLPTAVLEEP